MAKHNEGSNWIAIGVAVLAVGLFMGWLATREPPASVMVAEPGDSAATASDSVRALSADQIAGPGAFDDRVGQTVQLDSVNVHSWLNPRLFWIELAGGEQYLVKMGDALVAAGRTAPAPGMIDLTGVVRQKDDVVLNSWLESGLLESDEQRQQANVGRTYLDAQQVQAAGAGN